MPGRSSVPVPARRPRVSGEATRAGLQPRALGSQPAHPMCVGWQPARASRVLARTTSGGLGLTLDACPQ